MQTAGHSNKVIITGGDIEARPLKFGSQHYWKEMNHRYTDDLLQHTATVFIQVDLRGERTELHLVNEKVLGIRELLRGSNFHHPSHSPMGVEP